MTDMNKILKHIRQAQCERVQDDRSTLMNTKSLEQRLIAISLLDGRNWDKVGIVSDYFSEFALIKYRIRIEIQYLIFLSQQAKMCRKITPSEKKLLNGIWQEFSLEDAVVVKTYEAKTNHDVKAVEYFLKEKLSKTTLSDVVNFIHFGLTSYDINIPAYGLMLSDFRKDVCIPALVKVTQKIKARIIETKDMTMLARTHGQPALPTTMGKELAVFYTRIKKEVKLLEQLPIEGKMTGAVGNLNALFYVAPDKDWISLSKKFIQSLGLVPNIFTTQIIPYESWIRLFDSIVRLNNILLGFSQDMWWYISFEYFTQKKKKDEVGSSTMSHKINPITFENAEGNLGFANAQFEFFGKKLSVSRLQRDLSDSTIKRDFGLAFGFTLLAWDSLLSGLGRIHPNPVAMQQDLDAHWEIFSEGVQTYLRNKGYNDAYELLKEKTRGVIFSKEKFHELIDTLPIKKEDKKYLKINNLEQYLGLAKDLTNLAIEE
jgi:adenylosuccinate lyase